MRALAQGQASDCSNPALDIFTFVKGMLTDVSALSFQIWDLTATPTQVYPSTPNTWQAVDIADPCPSGDHIGTGHYLARWSVPSNANVGRWQIKWQVNLSELQPGEVLDPTIDNDPSTRTFIYQEEFDVLTAGSVLTYYPLRDYCLISDMRDEGVTTAQADDTQVKKRISLASRFIEAATRRFFAPRLMTVRMNGTGGAKLFFNDPIIALDYLKFEISPLYPEDFTIVETDIMRVYNRHLTMGLTEPDDRNNPKIELFNPGFVRERHTPLLTRLNFPIGQQNVEVKAVFGYTDPDVGLINTPGQTPYLIRHVCKLLVMKELSKMAKTAARFDARNRYRLTSETTRDQSYTLEPLGGRVGALFTGDPEIDNVLSYFSRPPAIGAA